MLFEEEIQSVFSRLSIPQNTLGYLYLEEAVRIVVINPESLKSVTINIYAYLAKKYGKKIAAIERLMRATVEKAWNDAEIADLHDVFGYCIDENKGKPTNSAFIALVAEQVRYTVKQKLFN